MNIYILFTDMVLVVPNEANKAQEIIDEMHNEYGYFAGDKKQTTHNNLEWLQIQFEPFVSKPITDDVYNDEVLYHITEKANVDNIMKNGIEPTNENGINGEAATDRPKQVRLLREHTIRKQWNAQAKEINNRRPRDLKTNEYVVLEIKVSELPSNMVFYGDSECPDEISVRETIPPDAIGVLTYLQIEK